MLKHLPVTLRPSLRQKTHRRIIHTIAVWLLTVFFPDTMPAVAQTGWAAFHSDCLSVSQSGGQVFFRHWGDGYRISEGVEQAYITLDTLADDICAGEAYNQYGIEYGDTLEAGCQITLLYTTGEFNHDKLFIHNLFVHPTFHLHDTLLLFEEELGSLRPGVTSDTLTSQFGCDSIIDKVIYAVQCASDWEGVADYGASNAPLSLFLPTILPTDAPISITTEAPSTIQAGTTQHIIWQFATSADTLWCEQNATLHFPPCGGDYYAIDGDGNHYETVRIGNDCWMKRNLRATRYAPSGELINYIPAQTFENEADSVEQVQEYGLLYNWFSAMGIRQEDDLPPVTNADGEVQGVCPVGWHIPSISEMSLLGTYNAEQLRATSDLWIHSGTDVSKFSAFPAGKFDSQSGFEANIRTFAHFWSTAVSGPSTAIAGTVPCFCREFDFDCFLKADSCSVRCIKD